MSKKWGCVVIMCRHLVSIIVGVVLLFSVMPAMAQETVNLGLSVNQVTGFPDSTVQVPIVLSSTGQVAGLQLDLSYDSSLLTYQSWSNGNLPSAFNVAVNPVGTGNQRVRVFIYNISGTKIQQGTVTIVILNFQVAANAIAGKNCSLILSDVTLSDESGNPITQPSPEIASSQFTVAAIDVTPPVYQRVVMDSAKKIATIDFNENLVNNRTSASELKASINLATDGKNFKSLNESDTVTINENTLVITYGISLTGINNKIKVLGNTLKDLQGNVLTSDVITDPIDAAIDQCFIATAAYGSKFAPAVTLLRQFRDEYLLTNRFGNSFVQFYYRNSPPIASYIAASALLKLIVRVLLLPIVSVVYLIVHPELLGIVAFIILIGMIANLRNKKSLLF